MTYTRAEAVNLADLSPSHPTLGDVTETGTIAQEQGSKRPSALNHAVQYASRNGERIGVSNKPEEVHTHLTSHLTRICAVWTL